MNLRSKKAPMKADIISTFHDAVLIHILSFLPLPDEHRTRVLSSRWKNLWALLLILHIVMPFYWTDEEVNRFHDSVDQTLDLRGGMPIRRFYLYCSKNCSYDRVYGWLRKVVQCKVQELELRFPYDRFTVRFCWDLFKTCTTLVSLTLRGEFVLNVPHEAEMLFPCLKTINLISIVYCCNKCFKNLICGCPVLEELFVERQLLNGQFDNMDVFEVLSPSMKRLRLSFALSDVIGNFRVVIDAPNLEYLKILDHMPSNYSLANTLKLTEAHVNMSRARPATQLVQHLSSVKTLTLTHMTLMVCLFIYLGSLIHLRYSVGYSKIKLLTADEIVHLKL
ncbi:F-box protein At4g09920-like [Bidens hawaiensis]|uniref:F-box protein At4g09920-like n=1 Tax=Bidens hawaiensis TaxID=980011 RepID=UPI00404A223D